MILGTWTKDIHVKLCFIISFLQYFYFSIAVNWHIFLFCFGYRLWWTNSWNRHRNHCGPCWISLTNFRTITTTTRGIILLNIAQLQILFSVQNRSLFRSIESKLSTVSCTDRCWDSSIVINVCRCFTKIVTKKKTDPNDHIWFLSAEISLRNHPLWSSYLFNLR